MKVSQISQVQQTTLSNSSSIDKDMFLKLLVAQMKYQDPINVQSNSEYITQFATFSQLEQISNMVNSMNMTRGIECIGKEVTIKDKNEKIEGIVEEVIFKDNNTYLKVNGNNYSINNLNTIRNKEER